MAEVAAATEVSSTSTSSRLPGPVAAAYDSAANLWSRAQPYFYRSDAYGAATRGLTATLVVLLYLLIFGAIFASNENWGSVESVYYVTVTMSTVGYGDRSPSDGGMRFVAAWMILIGIFFVFPLIAGGVGFINQYVTSAGRTLLGRLYPQRCIDIDGDGETD
jgi:hypothetical protein